MAPPDNPPLTKDKDVMTVAERSELIIDEALTVLEKPAMARLLNKVPCINFHTGTVIDPVTKEPKDVYQPPVDDKGVIDRNVITAKSIEKVRIDTGDGQGFRYFTRVNVEDNKVKLTPAPEKKNPTVAEAVQRAKDSGFRASAWLETDEKGKAISRNKEGKVVKKGKPVLRFAFPGLETANELGLATKILLGGKFNPQVHGAPGFIDDTLKKLEKEKEKYGLTQEDIEGITAHVASASMGTSNGMAAQVCLLLRGIHCDTMTASEPFSMKLAHDKITDDLKTNGLLTQNIRGFLGENFDQVKFDQVKKALLDPARDWEHYHAYRTQETAADGRTVTLSKVANLPKLDFLGGWTLSKLAIERNKTLAKENDHGKNETGIDMNGYVNATDNDLINWDPLHLNGTIMLQLHKENIEAAKKEREANKGKDTPKPDRLIIAHKEDLPDGEPTATGLPKNAGKKAPVPGKSTIKK